MDGAGGGGTSQVRKKEQWSYLSTGLDGCNWAVFNNDASSPVSIEESTTDKEGASAYTPNPHPAKNIINSRFKGETKTAPPNPKVI